MVLMMRTLRALTSSMLRSKVALLKAPATRGRALVASRKRDSAPGSSATANCEARSPSRSQRLSVARGT